MDNPEEVLQALDEFQKIRPSEIPRELEDYLCFVAKTGDPVYQWSLIKPLFREKLVRVMTDFYESCPTLDLASSSNIEHFNYDIMKCNLLSLLESFANAPFTVQRICELLTSPRKEYNRVDKFMRAIEKNILVVSTKEPGPAARRSENGDSMVNGTIDDDETTPTTNEVEMESWVKDCTTDTNVSTIPSSPIVGENDVSLMVTAAAVVIPTTKDLISDDDDTSSVIQGKNLDLQTTTTTTAAKSSEMTVSNFIAAAHEMSNTTNITSTIPSKNPNTSSINTNDSSCNSTTQNTSSSIIDDISDTSPSIGIVSDVTEAIINEDTSSQPSLDSESGDDSETHVAINNATATGIIAGNSKKLQTTFHTKDFVKIDENDDDDDDDDNDNTKISNTKYYENDSRIGECKLSSPSPSIINNDTDINVDGDGRLTPVRPRDETTLNSDEESKSSSDSNSESIEKRTRIDDETPTTITGEVGVTTADKNDTSESNFASGISMKTDSNSSNGESNSNEIDNKLINKNNEQLIIDKTPKIIGELIDKTSDLSSNNSIIQSDSSLSTTEQHNPVYSSDSTTDIDNLKESETITEIIEDTTTTSTSESSSKPIIDEPPYDDIENLQKSEQKTNVVIEEAMDDDVKETNTMIPHPIPIIEEPKDDDDNAKSKSTVMNELSVDNYSVDKIEQSEIVQREQCEQINETSTGQIINTKKIDAVTVTAASSIDAATSTIILPSNLTEKQLKSSTESVELMESKTVDAGESMEIDNEETMTVFQRIDDDDSDEPMEQESGELIKS